MENNTINQKAIDLLDQAAFTSSAIKDKERRDRSVKDEHLYPVTKQETLQMQALLAQAWDAADDREEAEFKDKYERLSEVVDWSLSRHKTWKWPVIAGALLFAALLLWVGVSNKDAIKTGKENVKIIKAWEPCDTVITWESCAYPASDAESMAAWKRRTENANLYKSYYLGEAKRRYLQNQESVASFRQKAEAETDQEKKEGYLKQANYWEKTLDEYKAEFDALAPLEFKDMKKEALKRTRDNLSSLRSDRNFFLINFLLVLILCGLYIWTGNPYGYDISKERTRHKVLGWIRKVGFWFAGAAFGTGLAARLFADDIVWKYSDGHTERESDVAGTAGNVVWKIILMVIGVIVFVAVAGIVMLLETAFGIPVKLRERKEA